MLRGPYLYPTVANRWIDDLGITGRTRTAYLSIARCFQVRLDGRRFNEITPDDVRRFVEVADDRGRRADRTTAKYLRVIWGVFDWALDPEVRLAEVNPAARLRSQRLANRRPNQPARRKHWLAEEQALALVAGIRAGARPVDRRDALMFGLFLTTGLRLSELLSLKWGDVNFTAGTIHVLGKGRKQAVISLAGPTRKLLLGWRSDLVAATGNDQIDFWPLVPVVKWIPDRFGSSDRESAILWDRPLRAGSHVRSIVAARADEAGLGHLAPHDLRRTFAGILADRGTPIEDIRRAMRHSNVAVTQIYLRDRPMPMSALDDLDFG